METRDQRSRAVARAPVARLEFGMEWPPKHVAAYLLECDAPVLIDAGIPADHGEGAMVDELAAAGYEPADVAAVVVTHPHSDHIGQVPLFREAGATVYAPDPVLEQLRRDDEDLYESVCAVARTAGLDIDRAENEAERARESLRRDRRLLDPDDTVAFPFDGTFTVEGQSFEPIHTPGHQVHHASLATTLGDERVCFSGDALIETFRAAALEVGLDCGAYDAIDNFYAGMDRLEDRGFDRVFPGHGPVFTDAAGAIASTRESLDDLVETTREVVDEIGPATPLELVHHRFGDVEYPAQLLDTLGALGTLQGDGAVTYEERNGVRYYDLA